MCNGTEKKFYRSIQIINWMMNDKWIPTSKKRDANDSRYYFSEIRNVFNYIAIKVYSKANMDYKGFVVFSFSVFKLNSIMKILDYHFIEPKDSKYIIPLAFKYARNLRANFIEFPESIKMYLNTRTIMQFLLKKRQRAYLYYSKSKNSLLKKHSHEIELNYCDGDTPFV
jgi:hypothetical protein